MPIPSTRIYVIIPVYGNWGDTVECLKALESQNTRDFQVLVADDGSPDPPPEQIRDSPLVHYRRYENAGFGANCNRAAREAIAEGATHLLLLNSDTTFGPAFMEQWVRRASGISGAILSPLIYWASHPHRIWSSGGNLTVLTPFVRSRTCFAQVTEVDIVTACAILVPSNVWTALDGFDPKYAMYFEDFDFVLRAKARGIRTCVVPDRELRMLHRVSGSFRNSHAWRRHYLMLTSSLIFIRSHYRGLRKLICLGLSFAHVTLTALLSLPDLPSPRLLWNAAVRGLRR